MNSPLLLQRPPMVSQEQLQQIEEAVFRLLAEVGIAVLRDDLRDFLGRRGFRVRENRVSIERQQVREFLDHERQRNGNKPARGPSKIDTNTAPFQVTVSNYPQHVHDIWTDEIVPFTTERLIEATKLVDVLAGRGVSSSPPGNPSDVSPVLQPIVQYWVSATHSRHGRWPIDPKAEESYQYVIDMAEALGESVRSLTVWVFSPLTLGGESLDALMKYAPRLREFAVNSMPSLGCTAPIHVGDALAMSVAEVVGSTILLQERIDLPFHWGIGLFPIDMRSMAMVFGSPENFLLQLMTWEVSAFFHGGPWYPAAGNVHCNAKLPGPQACAEKSSLMTAGALLGARSFASVGTLSLDEVFSAEQLLYDLEIKDHVQRLVTGMSADCDPGRCLEDVVQSFAEKGFTGLSSTLDAYNKIYWHPALFERDFLGAWHNAGARTIRDKTRAQIPDLLRQHDFALAPSIQMELDRLLARARAALS